MKVAEGQTSKLDTASPYGRRHTRQVLWFHGLYTLKKAVRIVQENPELILILNELARCLENPGRFKYRPNSTRW